MARFLPLSVWLLATGMFFSASAAAQATTDLTPYLGQSVAKLEILYGGAPLRGEDATLADLIGMRVGEPLRLSTVHDAIIRLYRSGQASQVVVTAHGPPTAMTLRFDIIPQPRVSQVIFRGVGADIRRTLRRRLTMLDPGRRVTRGRLNRAAEQIVEYYHRLGYFNAEAFPAVSLEAGGRQATVIFRVKPGRQTSVKSIQFEGRLKLNPSDVLARFQLRPGQPYSAFRLRDDVQRLRQLHVERGYLALHVGSPRIERDIERNTVNITIPVDSGPKVEIQVEGISLSQKQKRRIFPTLRAGGIDPATLEEGRLNLLDELQRRGYFFAEVGYTSHQLTPVEPASRRLIENRRAGRPSHTLVIVYHADPGRKYNLKEIRIEGTDAISYQDVKAELGSQVKGRLSRGLTSRELIAADRRVIVDFLRARGYLNARVVETRSAVALNREDLIIIHAVETGPRSRIAEIVFDGNQVFSDAELRAQVRLTEHQPLSQPKVSEDVARLAAFYNSRGYAESTLDAQVEPVQEGAADVRVIFKIREGNQLRIHRILVRGNESTREKALKKFLTFREGDLLVKSRFAESEQNLYSTSAFRRVAVSTEPAGIGPGTPNQRNVLIQLDEAPRFLITYGGGFRTDDGPRGLFEITNTNLLGQLYTGSFRVRASRREQLGQLSFTNPRPFGSQWPVLLSTFFQREERDAFDASRLTGLVQVERELPNSIFLILRYSFSNVIISDVTEPERLRRQDTTVQIGRVSASFLRDRRDSALAPTRGDFTSIDLSLASSRLVGDANFVRFFGEHQQYFRLVGSSSTLVATDARIGLAKPYGSSTAIPISERFFAGGSTTLRGFGFEEAGPRGADPNDSGQTQPLGGNALVILNAELRFPIWKRFGLGGAAFYDTGNVFEHVSDISLRDFSHTLGFGLRLKTPVGPVRVDFGALVKREPLVPRTQLHISFGLPF